ncbi:2OG-Fe(II) oxygenase [Hugenholtzia roseola]|uniref:2OG-Fe(II) oxygenase n=1 Tax=Hugenholtzia roseola TaxID=1002 RepID=UPI0004251561|nr:2OG-Fe(II) oxygenase [Hugenholtzia roseola]
MLPTYHNSQVWTIDNFLSPKTCEDLILFSEQQGYQEATVGLASGEKMIKNIRNNDRLVYQDENLAKQFWLKLKDFCPPTIENSSAVGLNEQFRFYRYEPMQRFKRHIDGRFRRNEIEESRITFMIYLNQDFTGGETKFDNFTIRPQTGMALCFIHEQKHEGVSVIEGTKYVLRSDVMYRVVSDKTIA